MVNRYTNEVKINVKTLKELKAENAEEVAAEPVEATQAEADEVETEVVAEVEADEIEDNANPDDTEAKETEVEAWMQTEEVEQGSDKTDAKFTDSDIGIVKQKLRAKMDKKHQSEVEQLKAEIEALKVKPTTAPVAPQGRPKREDFYDADDPDDAYVDALTDWKLNNRAATSQQEATKQAQAQKAQTQLSQIEEKVNKHYTKAAELTKTNGISEDVYRQADQNVRQAVESVAPNLGDAITDALIAKIGDDSEKVMYYLGRNQNKLLEFEKALRNDNSGIEAALMLGEIKRDLVKPLKRKSNAPAPAPSIKGDDNTSDKTKSYLRKYKEAEKSNNRQKAFEIKREAKKAGIKTRDW